MSLDLLHVEMGLLSPESKFFLIRLLLDFRSSSYINIPVSEMVHRYGITRAVVCRSLKTFCGQKILEPVDTVSSGRGRPQSRYKIREDILERIICQKKNNNGLDYDDVSIKQFLRFARFKSSNELTVSNVLLLVLLMSLMSKSGAVDSVGCRELSLWMGISENRLHSQLRKLRKLGYIEYCIPGLSDKLLGKRTAIYFLNLGKLNVSYKNKFLGGSLLPSERSRYSFRNLLLNARVSNFLNCYEKDVLQVLLNFQVKELTLVHMQYQIDKMACCFLTGSNGSSVSIDDIICEVEKCFSYSSQFKVNKNGATMRQFLDFFARAVEDQIQIHLDEVSADRLFDVKYIEKSGKLQRYVLRYHS
ncbi:hypothetical protein QNF07_002637 [Vibrio alginolyticus]|nr:hypothetical protein [Vibrio alginolyticus]